MGNSVTVYIWFVEKPSSLSEVASLVGLYLPVAIASTAISLSGWGASYTRLLHALAVCMSV